MTTTPFPAVQGPYGYVYWLEEGSDDPLGNLLAAQPAPDGSFDPEEGINLTEFAEPLTHGQLIDVLLGLGAAAILREREQRAALESLCVVMEDDQGKGTQQWHEQATRAMDAARHVLGIPDDYSTADFHNLNARG